VLLCSTSCSLWPVASSDILHNSRWLLFHPRAVTPLGSSPRTRVSASVHYACSHLCICAQGDQIHHTHEASRKSVTCHLLREVNLVVVFDLIMITTAKSSRLLLHFTACNHSSERYSILSMATSFRSGLSLFSDRCSCSSHRYPHLSAHPLDLALVLSLLALLLLSLPCSP
jgi:hypothetical protein